MYICTASQVALVTFMLQNKHNINDVYCNTMFIQRLKYSYTALQYIYIIYYMYVHDANTYRIVSVAVVNLEFGSGHHCFERLSNALLSCYSCTKMSIFRSMIL